MSFLSHQFPVLGRCRDVLFLEKAPPQELPQSGIDFSCRLKQTEVFQPLQSVLPRTLQEEKLTYPRSLYAIKFRDGYITHQGGYISRDSRLIGELSEYYTQSFDGHRYLHSLRLFKRIEKITEPVVSLSGSGQYNYYHWWLDILPRFHLLEKYGNIPDNPLYYVETSKPFQRDTLRFLGIPENRWLNSRDHQIITGKEMWGASPKSPARRPDPWAVAWLRERFLAMGQAPAQPVNCVVVSRRKAKNRRILNEDQLLEAVKPLRPVLVELENLTVAEQIGLFAQARWIIAPHGAGLSNMLFVRPDCHVIELFGATQANDCYPLLAEVLGCPYSGILGEDVINPQTREIDMRVDLQALRQAVEI